MTSRETARLEKKNEPCQSRRGFAAKLHRPEIKKPLVLTELQRARKKQTVYGARTSIKKVMKEREVNDTTASSARQQFHVTNRRF